MPGVRRAGVGTGGKRDDRWFGGVFFLRIGVNEVASSGEKSETCCFFFQGVFHRNPEVWVSEAALVCSAKWFCDSRFVVLIQAWCFPMSTF